MISWTLGQWICYSIVWLWGTWLSSKLGNLLEGAFNAKILAIYPYYKVSKQNSGIPAWLVGAACVFFLPTSSGSVKSFINLDTGWLNGLIAGCLFSLIIILPLTYFGWLLPNQFRVVGATADAAAMRWKSMEPYDPD
jgi:hypothetical protein